MVRPELRLDLRSALYQAARDRTSVEVRATCAAPDGGALRPLKIVVRPSPDGDGPPRGFFVVFFEEPDHAAEGGPAVSPASALTPDAAVHIEEELSRLKSQLRMTVEQHSRQVEDAKASNEELQAVNEELRSAAEELETSKEELQSVNEELTTVNQELKIKIEELGLANNDFQNLINSTRSVRSSSTGRCA